MNISIVKRALNSMSTVTDWISAGSDIVVAIIAFLGYFLAKDWKREATKEAVIENAMKLLTDTLPKIKSIASDYVHITTIKDWLERVLKKESVNYNDINELYMISRRFNESHNKIASSLVEYFSEIKKNRHLSWKVNKDKDEIINAIQSDIWKIYIDELQLLASMQTILKDWGVKFSDPNFVKLKDDGNTITAIKNHENLHNANNLATRIFRTKEDIVRKFEELNIDDITIFDLFEAKK